MSNKYLKAIKDSQTGYASFVIVLITIIVISLIVVAFAADSRLEQKNSLANNLANQAYYAAESGINDAYAIIKADLANGVTPTKTTGCANSSNGQGYITLIGGNNTNQLSSQVQYTCLIVNPSPPSVGNDVSSGDSWVIPISTASNIQKLTISWQSDQTSGSLSFGAGCPRFSFARPATLPTFASYSCGAGVLQLDYISNSDLSGQLTSGNQFNSKATTLFFEPTSSGSVSVNGTYFVHCSTSPPSAPLTNPNNYDCSQTFNVNSSSPASTFYLHIVPFYVSSNITIVAQDSAGVTQNITGAQVLIDSTGDASGQLKRLQARVCDNAYCNNGSTAGAIQSATCINKKFTVYPGDSTTDPNNPVPC